ncbi:degenerate transposase [Streptococcus pneumoniae]|nr:degenerate transposase [Streptococcus pneumoniae]
MGRNPKTRPEERTELERLQSENEYLRAENAILKKLREVQGLMKVLNLQAKMRQKRK